MGSVKLLCHHLIGMVKEIMRNIPLNSQFYDRDSNKETPKYEA